MPTATNMPPGSSGGVMPPLPPQHHQGGPGPHHMMNAMHERDQLSSGSLPQGMMGGPQMGPPGTNAGPPMMHHQGPQLGPSQHGHHNQPIMGIPHHSHGPPTGPGGPPMPHHPMQGPPQGGAPMPGPGHHPHMHPGPNPAGIQVRVQPFLNHPECRIFEMNKRLQQRNDFDSLWWDMFTSDFFDDDATLTILMMDDGPKRYSIGRILIPRFFRSFFESGCCELYFVLRMPREIVHPPQVTLDSESAMWVMNMNKPPATSIIIEGRLTLDFNIEDMRMRSWMFQYRCHREMIPRNMLNFQDLPMIDQFSKNLTRCGFTMNTLNFLRMCVILEPMQELMSRQKAYSLAPRDCLKTTLFQKWQRMLAPQNQGGGKASAETPRPQTKRKKRKASGTETGSTSGRSSKRKQSPGPVPGQNMAQPGEVMIVGEPTLMGGDFGDEDERRITRLENTQFDPGNCMNQGMIGPGGGPGPHGIGPPHMMQHQGSLQNMQSHQVIGHGGPPSYHMPGGPPGSRLPPGMMMGEGGFPPGDLRQGQPFPGLPGPGRPPSASVQFPPGQGPPGMMMPQGQSPHHPMSFSGPNTPCQIPGPNFPQNSLMPMDPRNSCDVAPGFNSVGGPPRASSAGAPKMFQPGSSPSMNQSGASISHFGPGGHMSSNSSPLMPSAGSGTILRSSQDTPPPPMLNAISNFCHQPASNSSPLMSSNKSLPSPNVNRPPSRGPDGQNSRSMTPANTNYEEDPSDVDVKQMNDGSLKQDHESWNQEQASNEKSNEQMKSLLPAKTKDEPKA